MHVLIAFLTAVASILFALDRLGVDIGWLNPWAWRRRRRWQKQLHVNPAFNLDSPMETVALLLLATAKIDGDLSTEEKNELRRIFEESFHQSASDASSLLNSSAYLLGSGEEVFARPREVLARSLSRFSVEQRRSCLELMRRISGIGSPASEAQADFLQRVQDALTGEPPHGTWE